MSLKTYVEWQPTQHTLKSKYALSDTDADKFVAFAFIGSLGNALTEEYFSPSGFAQYTPLQDILL